MGALQRVQKGQLLLSFRAFGPRDERHQVRQGDQHQNPDNDQNHQQFRQGKVIKDLRAGDVPSFMERLKAFFAGIPYELNDDTERHYQVIFYLVFRLMGQFVDAEVRSAKGRADAVVKTKDRIYVFEFKLNGTAEEALAQIETQGYLEPYAVDARQKVAVGINFNKETRNIDRYLVK